MFILEYPYTEKWTKGYLQHNGDRNTVTLYNSHTDRSSTSYARYLMSVHLGRFLLEHEHVDHVDDDKNNDTIGNLQILTLASNNLKESKRRGRLRSEIKCPMCSVIFTRRKGNTQAVKCFKGRVVCCSKDCSDAFKSKGYSKGQRNIISEESLIRVFRKH